eukprot:1140039-Pelagomonas_calceolata.AAC.1
MVGMVGFEKENWIRAYPAAEGSCPPLKSIKKQPASRALHLADNIVPSEACSQTQDTNAGVCPKQMPASWASKSIGIYFKHVSTLVSRVKMQAEGTILSKSILRQALETGHCTGFRLQPNPIYDHERNSMSK